MKQTLSWYKALLLHGALMGTVIVVLYPVFWVLSLALEPGRTPAARVLPWPEHASLEHFRAVILSQSQEGLWLFPRQLLSSVLISTATAVLAVVLATPAAYALARFRFVGAREGTGVLLATQMMPGVASAVPLYLILDGMKLLNTAAGLVLVYATTSIPFAVFQLRGAFEAIPKELEEAAMVDGATRWQAFVRVILPVARPSLAVTALYAFMSAWNEFILASTFLSSESAQTLPVALRRYVGEHDAAWGHFAAGAIVVSVPVMVLFYALQRHLVGGLTAGGVKG